jgi:hypothetical protein
MVVSLEAPNSMSQLVFEHEATARLLLRELRKLRLLLPAEVGAITAV